MLRNLGLLILFAAVASTASKEAQIQQATAPSSPPVGPVVNATLRIIGGTVATIAQFPYMTALLSSSNPSQALQSQYCGGSLVRLNWVITAGHCCEGRTGMYTGAGQADLTQMTSANLKKVKGIFIHPNYTRSGGIVKNDYCLLALSSSYSLSNIGTATIPTPQQGAAFVAGVTGSVAGWGDTSASSDETFPTTLRTVNVPLLPTSTAQTVIGVAPDPSWLYAGTSGKDSCVGDSGGPLVINGLLAGLVSWGLECSGTGVYARVDYAYNWLENTMNTYTNIPDTNPSTAAIIESAGQTTTINTGQSSTNTTTIILALLGALAGLCLCLCCLCALLYCGYRLLLGNDINYRSVDVSGMTLSPQSVIGLDRYAEPSSMHPSEVYSPQRVQPPLPMPETSIYGSPRFTSTWSPRY